MSESTTAAKSYRLIREEGTFNPAHEVTVQQFDANGNRETVRVNGWRLGEVLDGAFRLGIVKAEVWTSWNRDGDYVALYELAGDVGQPEPIDQAARALTVALGERDEARAELDMLRRRVREAYEDSKAERDAAAEKGESQVVACWDERVDVLTPLAAACLPPHPSTDTED